MHQGERGAPVEGINVNFLRRAAPRSIEKYPDFFKPMKKRNSQFMKKVASVKQNNELPPFLLLELTKRPLPCSDVLEHHVLAQGSHLCTSFSVPFSVICRCKSARWKYLHHGDCKTLQIRALSPRSLCYIYQHTFASN